jgi:oligopeptidase B
VDVAPPVAAKHPHAVTSPHGTRDDPYFWLRDDPRQNPAVLAYLDAENAYAAKMLAPAKPLEEQLAREMSARVDENESTARVFDNDYWYWTRYETGKQRPIFMRQRGDKAEVLLDSNTLATGHSFYAVGDYAVSRDNKLLAWTDDVVGRNQFELHIKNLETGELFADSERAIAPSVEWANDSKTLFMVGKDPTTLREDRVLRHPLGGKTELAYQEADTAYYVDIAHTKTRNYITITLDATDTSETRLIDAYAPEQPPTVFRARKEGVRYEIDQTRNFIVRTNEGAPNYKLVEIQFGVERMLIPPSDAVIEGFAAYRGFVAADIRRAGMKRIEIVDAGGTREIKPDEIPSTLSLIDTPDIDAYAVRYSYESLVTPATVYEVALDGRSDKKVLQRDYIPTYDASKYKTEYRHAGRVPISIVYRKDTKLDGTAPLLVFGYGAYGEALEPTFDRTPVSLLDRGWVYAIAHVRGGGELGQAWYDDGRLLAKKHTFEDFIAATEYLIAHRYGNRAYAEGASAGGLVMGAIANMRPDLYRGIVAWVPFVDVVTTMLDASIPLVTNEYDEWGDPADKTAYDYMLSYSPYDNVGAHPYPALYVRTGLWDSQVQYYEPAKWVAKLRATKRDDHLLVFETDMHAGHEGSSGRFEAIREYARAYAFMLFVDGTQ